MNNKDKIDCVIKLLTEITSSQYLGSRCSEIMDINEDELVDVASYVKNILKDVNH